jgi:hypothetical protein
MSDLADFLLAQIADVEVTAQDMQHQERLGRPLLQLLGGGTGIRSLVDPARVLAECEAKRRIVSEHGNDHGDCRVCAEDESFSEDSEGHREFYRTAKSFPCPTLRMVALPYSDHPDYPL